MKRGRTLDELNEWIASKRPAPHTPTTREVLYSCVLGPAIGVVFFLLMIDAGVLTK